MTGNNCFPFQGNYLSGELQGIVSGAQAIRRRFCRNLNLFVRCIYQTDGQTLGITCDPQETIGTTDRHAIEADVDFGFGGSFWIKCAADKFDFKLDRGAVTDSSQLGVRNLSQADRLIVAINTWC
ncbi:hypothetical protein D3C75_981580 [compost metagenome]